MPSELIAAVGWICHRFVDLVLLQAIILFSIVIGSSVALWSVNDGFLFKRELQVRYLLKIAASYLRLT